MDEKPNRFSIDEIKTMVKKADVDELKKRIDPKFIQEVNAINEWKKEERVIEFKPEVPQKMDKKKSNARRSQAEQAALIMGTKINTNKEKDPKQQQQFDIILGRNETLETRKKKEELKEKATVNYAEEKQKETANLDQIQQAEREINFILNKIAPENLKEVSRNLNDYVA